MVDRVGPRFIGFDAVDSCQVTTWLPFFDPMGNPLVDRAGSAYPPDGPRMESTGAFELQELVHPS